MVRTVGMRPDTYRTLGMVQEGYKTAIIVPICNGKVIEKYAKIIEELLF